MSCHAMQAQAARLQWQLSIIDGLMPNAGTTMLSVKKQLADVLRLALSSSSQVAPHCDGMSGVGIVAWLWLMCRSLHCGSTRALDFYANFVTCQGPLLQKADLHRQLGLTATFKEHHG